jgi:hypothetical protein
LRGVLKEDEADAAKDKGGFRPSKGGGPTSFSSNLPPGSSQKAKSLPFPLNSICSHSNFPQANLQIGHNCKCLPQPSFLPGKKQIKSPSIFSLGKSGILFNRICVEPSAFYVIIYPSTFLQQVIGLSTELDTLS